MAAFQQMSRDLGEVWSNIIDGWRSLSRRASRAITRFTLGKNSLNEAKSQEIMARSSGWGVLACEVFDNDRNIVVRLEAPGMDREDFNLQMQDNYLLVRGEKQMSRERTQGGYHISECAYGSFGRAIPLPDDVDIEKAKASYKRGVLRVELPKSNPGHRVRIKLR